MLKKKEKEKIIDDLADNLARCAVAITTDYRGLTAKDMVKLRRILKENNIEYRVAKNTLMRFAAQKIGKQQLESLLSGPLAVAFGYDDVVKPAKIINDFARSSGVVFKVTGGLLGNQILSAKQMIDLANMPSKEILVARLVSQLSSPIYFLHNVLSAPIRNLGNVLQARIGQLEKM